MTKYLLPLLLLMCLPLTGTSAPKGLSLRAGDIDKMIKILAKNPDLLFTASNKESTEVEKKQFSDTKNLAEKGDITAQLTLSEQCRMGTGVKQNYPESLKWLGKAAEQGQPHAQSKLAYTYDNVLKDYKEGARWYRKAAEQGWVQAQANLGVDYAIGEGAEKNLVTAYAWYTIAALNGHKAGQDLKSQLSKNLTPVQINEGLELSLGMIKKNPKLLKD